jgi:hypothetical protein
MKYKLKKHNSGFIAVVSLMLIVLFGIFGVMYWFSSKSNAELIMFESDRIKARNYAMAGIEKVKIHLFNQYNQGNKKPEYKEGADSRLDKEYNIKFGDGSYKVTKVSPLGDGVGEWYGRPHFSRGLAIGFYDLWEIVCEGTVEKTRITAEVTAVVKIYRDDMVLR